MGQDPKVQRMLNRPQGSQQVLLCQIFTRVQLLVKVLKILPCFNTTKGPLKEKKVAEHDVKTHLRILHF